MMFSMCYAKIVLSLTIKALITGSGFENLENRQISKLQDSKAGKLESAVFVFPASENNQVYVDDNQSNKGKAK